MPGKEYFQLYIANDNSPFADRPLGDAVGFNAILRERQNDRQARETLALTNRAVNGNQLGLWLSLLIWIVFGGAAFWCFYTSQPIDARIITTIGLIWSGLWTRFLAIDHIKPRLAELALLSTLVGFIGLMMTATLQMGFPMTLPGGIVTLIAAALVVSVINHSRIALMCAIGGGLFWAALQLDGFIETGSYAIALPALWTLTVLQAIRLKTITGVLVSVITGYCWLAGSAYQAYSTGTLTALYLCVGAIVIGSLHYRASKAAEDEGLPYMEFSVAAGWFVANAGLLWLAKFGLDPEAAIWANNLDISSIVRIAWIGLMGGSVAIYALASFVRQHHNHMSISGTVLTVSLLAALPASILFLPVIEAQFLKITGLTPYPSAGLFLFGMVTGHILFFISNAFRRHKYFQVFSALMMVAFLAYQARGIDLVFQEGWVVWLLGTMSAALVCLIAVEPQLATQDDPDMRLSVSSI